MTYGVPGRLSSTTTERRRHGTAGRALRDHGKDAEKLQSYYSELFGWKIDSNNPMNYGLVQREGNTNAEGVGIGGGVGAAPEGYDGHVTFYVEVPDVEAALAKAESLGGSRMMGPDKVMEGVEIGLFLDPEGHTVGLVKSV
jgi:predicted enzyme related to lactoylglutathione lyase